MTDRNRYQSDHVSLLLVETIGALGAAFMTILRIHAKQARLPGATDLTQYGEGRASTKAFLTHHPPRRQHLDRGSGGRRPNRAQRRHLARAASVSCHTASPKLPWACMVNIKSVVALYR